MRIRTGYSFRHSAGMLPEVLKRLQAIGYQCAPITDRGSTFGFARWSKLCEEAKLKPIFGVEIGVTTSLKEKGHDVDHWTFIAIDDIAAVNKLLQLATKQFYYEPLLTYEQALAATGVVRIMGRRAQLEHVGAPQERLYAGLSPSCSKGYINLVNQAGHPWVACSDNRYPAAEDFTFYELLVGREAANQTYPQHILTDDEWIASLKTADVDGALVNRTAIMAQCNATLRKGELYHPARTATLRELCEQGAARIGCDITRPEYATRLTRELDLIAAKNFEDYFFIIADLCQWARQRMIVGPARGSSCGSLVCYLLEITTVDPIYYGLLFERFIDVDRNDLPDIDIDFSDQKRKMVFDYMEEKYGRAHVARLGTVALFKPRSALAAAGAAFGIPKWRTESFADQLVKRSSGDARALNTFEDGLKNTPNGQALLKEFPQVMLATRMEGHPNHYSQHAAAVILTQEPVSNYVAIDDRTGATHCDKKDAEALNLLKIDALGLTQLSIFEDALELARLPRLHLETVPKDDEAALSVLRKGHFAGIFQFNGNSLQSLTKQVPIESIEDIISITALARPGPMGSGSAMVWVRRRNGAEAVSYPHPIFEDDLGGTLGIVMYQEQVMQLGRRVGGFTWKEVTALRKAMSKSLGKEYFNQFGEKFIAGALKEGVDHQVAVKVWDDLCLSGDTKLLNPFPSKGAYKYITLRDLYLRGGKTALGRQQLLMWNGKSVVPAVNWGVKYSGKKQTFTLTTASGNEIHATADHKFLMPDGNYKALENLSVGDRVMSVGHTEPTPRKRKKGIGSGGHNWWHKLTSGAPILKHNLIYLRKMFSRCQHCHRAPYQETHHINQDHEDHRLENLLPVCRRCHKFLHALQSGKPRPWSKGKTIFEDGIVSIKPRKVEDVYDVHMPDPHNNFVAEGIVVHNCAYGSWAFNRSHAVAYGIISYWCCWLKAHYPVEFAAASLTHQKDEDKQLLMLRELAAEGVNYKAVDVLLSTDKWTVGNDKNGARVLIGPVQNVKGIGPKAVSEIMENRKRGTPISSRTAKLLERAETTLDSLYPIQDAIRKVMPDPTARNIHSPVTPISDISEGEFMIFAVVDKIAPRDENEAINVARRGGQVYTDGMYKSVNLIMRDDTGTIYAKVNRFKYERLGAQVVERGGVGKALYAVKGFVRGDSTFKMLHVNAIRFIGMMEGASKKESTKSAKGTKPEREDINDNAGV